ncbi:TniQ family protein [Xanthomonas sp. NCPPB 1638]|uniref:TniQ family protein n=1 Tax=Xanthomonas TaxID=338 RepID=UPI0013314EDA|nr:TniQ family protein [Xanthomonas cucurbitae]WDM74794.1 TniQ family protein [Xanthomonas cucurbitae]
MSPLTGELWPAHPKPLPDELLTSWIVRIAKANGLKLQTFCDRVFGKEHQLWNRDIDRSAPDWLLAALARHTGTSFDAVRRTTLDIYRGRLFHERHSSGQLHWILPIGIYHRTRRRYGLQFCPQCLAEDAEPYFRTRWRVAALTYCPRHELYLHDRCPACGAPVTFHRRELGRPDVTDSGPLCLCHACNCDLRDAGHRAFFPYDASIITVFARLADYVSGTDSDLDIGYTDVLHQLCKVMVSTRKSSNLAVFVAEAIGTENLAVPRGRCAFELRPVEHRAHIIQLAAWLLADPKVRIPAAWLAKAVRYSHLLKDFRSAPAWYCSLVKPLNKR